MWSSIPYARFVPGLATWLALAWLAQACVAEEPELGTAELVNSADEGSADSVGGRQIVYSWTGSVLLVGNEHRGVAEVVEATAARVRVRGELVVVRPGPRGYFEASVAADGLVSELTTELAMLLWTRPSGSTDAAAWRLFQVDAPGTARDGVATTLRASYFYRIGVDALTGEVVATSTGSFEDGRRVVLRELAGANTEWGLMAFPASNWGSLEGEHAYVVRASCNFGACTATGEPTLPVPPDPDGTYVVAAVDDNGLWDMDMDVMAAGLSWLGYSRAGYDADVSASTLAAYLGRPDVTTVYFTGHGYPGGVHAATGYVSRETATLRATNTIFAACRTLSESWAASMGPESQTVLGYTEPTDDFLDVFVARSFIGALRDGRSYVEAWYLANNAYSGNAGIWAAYVREASGIVEYSARSGVTPIAAVPAAAIEIAPGVHVASTLLDDRRTFDDAFAPVEVVEQDELATEMAEPGFGLLSPVSFSPEEAFAAAEEWLGERSLLPEDAVGTDIVRIRARHEGETVGDTVGYVVRFGREVAGLPVRGNLLEDHVALLVTDAGVVSTSRYWPRLAAGEPGAFRGQLLSIADATRLAADEIATTRKGGEIHLSRVRPVHGTRGAGAAGERLVPAFELGGPDGAVVVDAQTGEPLGLGPE